MNEDGNTQQPDIASAIMQVLSSAAVIQAKLFGAGVHSRLTHRDALYMFSIMSIEGCVSTDLVKLIGCSRAQVSKTLSDMEERGLIVRVDDPDDGRRQFLRVSEEYLNYLNMAHRFINESMDRFSFKYSQSDIDIASSLIVDVVTDMKDTILRTDGKFIDSK